MFSAPPARAILDSSSFMPWAHETTACSPEPQSRFSVRAGASTGTPASRATWRARYGAPSWLWITFPITTLSTFAGSRPDRSNAPLAAATPKPCAETSFKPPPNAPNAVRAPSMMYTSVIRSLLSLPGRLAAIHHDSLAGHVAAGRRGQKQYCTLYVLRATEAAQRYAFEHLLFVFGDDAAAHLGREPSGGYGVDADAVAGEAGGEVAGHGDHGALAGVVADRLHVVRMPANQARDRGD